MLVMMTGRFLSVSTMQKSVYLHSTAETIAEVAFTNGSAHATGNQGGDPPADAFLRGDISKRWHSGNDVKTRGFYPKMIWYDFSVGNGFVPARITFQGTESSYFSDYLR